MPEAIVSYACGTVGGPKYNALMAFGMLLGRYGRQRVLPVYGRASAQHCKQPGFIHPQYTTHLLLRMIAVPSQTAYMLTYDALLNNVLPHSSCTPLVAGMLARATVSSITSPLELLRTRLQSTPASPLNPHTLKSTLIGIQSMVQTSGIRSLWLGLSSTLWRDVPFSGIYWIGYENGRAALRRRGYEGPAAAFASGATSGTVAALFTSPFDVLKTRKQAYLQTKSSGSMSTLAVSIRVVRAEGYQALFAGLTPRLAKIAPACGIMISCYEVSLPP